MDSSTAIVLSSTTPILVVVLVLGERPGWQAWLGIGVVVAGVVLFGLVTLRRATGGRPLRRSGRRVAG